MLKLKPATAASPWYVRDIGGLVGFGFGFATLIAGFWTQFSETRALTDPSDLNIVLPLLAAALLAGTLSILRREPRRVLGVAGMAMAGAAPLLGWVLLVAAVAVVALVVLLLVTKFQ